MTESEYAWRIETTLAPASLYSVLEPFRPFRNEVNFSTGFSTREFGDQVAYANPQPLGKLHHFEAETCVDGNSRILDIGCNLGYYSHHFVRRGARLAVGIEYDARLFSAAVVLRTIAGISDREFALIHGDFGEPATHAAAARLGPYDLILFLGSSNNVTSLTSALLALPPLMRPGGMLVIEFLAIGVNDPVCRFHGGGFRGDSSNVWSFSEAFLDDFLAASGIAKVARTLEWQNHELLGEYKKIMALYRRDDV